MTGDGSHEPAVHVPDGEALPGAWSRTTTVGVMAHPDDLELGCLHAIGPSRGADDRWFGGVVCTDGSGSVRAGAAAGLGPATLAAARWREQVRAADLGGYSAVWGLGMPSAALRGDGYVALVDRLGDLLAVAAAEEVITHDPVDRHRTHRTVARATIEAVGRLPPSRRPRRLLAVEGWRSLDWAPRHRVVRLDTSAWVDLAADLLACFPTQVGSAKRYDLAAAGRRRANATFADARAADEAEAVVLALDLTDVAAGRVSLEDALGDLLERFRREVVDGLDPGGGADA